MTEPLRTAPPISPDPRPRQTADSRPSDAAFRRLTFFGILAGLTPLVPVPFLDDRIHDAVKRRMVKEIAEDERVVLGDDARDVLAMVERPAKGLVGWLKWGLRKSFFLVLKLIRKVYRKVLIFLAIKEGIDTASRAFHEGYLLHVGLARHRGETLGVDGAEELRAKMDGVLKTIDPRPINQAIRSIFSGSKDLLKTASQLLARPFQGSRSRAAEKGAPEAVPAEAEAELLSGMTDRLSSALQGEQGYLDRLAAELARA